MKDEKAMEDKKSKVWFVTGAAKGIGKAIVDMVLSQGDCVIATARNTEEMGGFEEYADQILVLRLDVSDPEFISGRLKQDLKSSGVSMSLSTTRVSAVLPFLRRQVKRRSAGCSK